MMLYFYLPHLESQAEVVGLFALLQYKNISINTEDFCSSVFDAVHSPVLTVCIMAFRVASDASTMECLG